MGNSIAFYIGEMIGGTALLELPLIILMILVKKGLNQNEINIGDQPILENNFQNVPESTGSPQ